MHRSVVMPVLASLLIGVLASPGVVSAQPGARWRREASPGGQRGFDPRAGRSPGGYERGFGGYRSMAPYGGGYGPANGAITPPRFDVPRPDLRARLWSRGQFLPPGYRGASVADPARYHLRTPPSGYGWVGDGRNAYLMQRSTGMVLDSVPEVYEPPRPYRRR